MPKENIKIYLSDLVLKVEKILSDEDYLLWRKKRAVDKNYSSHNEDYLKGYEDCLNNIKKNIGKLKIEE